MTSYRKAFVLAVIGNFALLALLLGGWWYWRGATRQRSSTSAASAAPSPIQGTPSESVEAPAHAPLAPVQLSAERLQSIGVRFGTVKRKLVQDEIRVTGNVAIDETRLSYVQIRFSGYIVKVFADSTYKYVNKGQPLFTIYSPELVAAEREYLIAKQNAQELSDSSVPGVSAGIESLVAASRDRLRQWNLSSAEITRLESSGEASEELEIDSSVAGYIIERNALPNLTVQPDTRLYTIADLSSVWVLAQAFQNDLGRIRVGEPALLTADSSPGRVVRGRVDFIYPDVDMSTRTARVRLIFSNPNLTLTPGMFVNVTLQVPLGNQLVIPRNGVLQSGTQQLVFVDKGAGYLEPTRTSSWRRVRRSQGSKGRRTHRHLRQFSDRFGESTSSCHRLVRASAAWSWCRSGHERRGRAGRRKRGLLDRTIDTSQGDEFVSSTTNGRRRLPHYRWADYCA